MPITPFHFGPGTALHALAPKRISFLAFCAANGLIDLEPLYYMGTDQHPLHRFFHTAIGATLIVVLTVALFMAARRRWLRNPLGWQKLGIPTVATGAAIGSYSHIVLDSFIHPDIAPLAPFTDSNPLLGLISSAALHWGCVAAGVLGMAILFLRQPGK